VTPVVLASTSATRVGLLKAAGVSFQAVAPGVEEAALQTRLITEGATPAQVALALAKAKALAVSAGPDVLVIGADQTLALAGQLFTKASDLGQARAHLLALRGRTHHLHAAVAVAQAGAVTWSTIETASLTVRAFSDVFLDAYLAANADAALYAVGGYALEEAGVQLFERIEGDYFTILGLPMLGLLGLLRDRGALPT